MVVFPRILCTVESPMAMNGGSTTKLSLNSEGLFNEE